MRTRAEKVDVCGLDCLNDSVVRITGWTLFSFSSAGAEVCADEEPEVSMAGAGFGRPEEPGLEVMGRPLECEAGFAARSQ